MAYRITEIEGIGPKYGETLGKAGINTTDDLLYKSADKKGRKAKAGDTGLTESQLLKWAKMADLTRQTPSEIQVEKWVEQAETLEPKISH